MRPSILLLFAALASMACNNEMKTDNNIGRVERLQPELDAIVKTDAAIEVIAEGFVWSEGPLWIPRHNMLLFSDIPPNTIYKWTPEKGKEVYLKPSGYTGTAPRGGEVGSNGLLLNNKGQLVLCQHGDRRVAVMNAPLDAPKPDFITLADKYQGKRLDSPNDAVFKSNGDLYFTDPPYGLEKNVDDSLKEAPYQGVYKLSSSGDLTLLTDTITRPNGIAFTPDEKTLIIASSDPAKAVWYAYEVTDSGTLVNGRIFHDATPEASKEPGLPDGLKVDRNGNVFATGPGGVWIFNREGKLLGKIRINSKTSNCALADQDKTLFVTAEMNVLKIRLRE